ncbi:WhiB family transcriptional regulator [Rhodococcus sp. RS1C4]|nr:WhiB family transcriptional regulator [Rhodococcus sp. RS1C4]OZC62297.1 WhiB family transcriptional regulator [Rhodococcus sp. 06-621-2]OZC79846.1 WhiB family transcriptional regulator [Rhodococcus sp. 06-418-1B]OZD19294.1 WhiB family transcriptional regulator [Rhodococcus sp. 06-156-3C]OZD21628.1 WhiB family transcriptional regulator [Rhodococcus sp. 06-156-4C]OZD25314.1 WhiB family transcriptional regulator [Rhodococcus sp. 06-156-4a]OZD33071.1 WhiB family transcriptional regulator [Rhod
MSTATIRTTCRYERSEHAATERYSATHLGDQATPASETSSLDTQNAGTLGDEVPCRVADPDLWFAETPGELERAKALCAECPIRRTCLSAALDRAEPWGVWGGEILDQGVVIARKRPRGRPRKQQVA